MINIGVLAGYIIKAIDLKYQAGIALARFTLDVNRDFKNPNSNSQTDFISCCQVWSKEAKISPDNPHKV